MRVAINLLKIVQLWYYIASLEFEVLLSMLKISKLADYATIVMSFLAKEPQELYNAAAIAEATGINLPTVSKLLKLLNEEKLLCSTRGTHGGYRLARLPDQISVASVITAVDGRPALTECSQGEGRCVHDQVCALRGNWRFINQIIFDVLDRLTLQDMQQRLGPIIK
jgi:FeS assembly SUF system regulator